MKKLALSLLVMAFLPMQLVSAAESICISVSGDPALIGVIGFMYVDDEGEQRLGSMGASFETCDVPAGTLYSFGYRVHFYSSDMPCGAQVLNQDSNVKLNITADGCKPEINHG